MAALLGACGGGDDDALPANIAVVDVDSGQDFVATRAQAIEQFVAQHGDGYDQVVFWDTNNLLNGQFSYHPIANDVTGIGYGHGSDEVFNAGATVYGTERLQGAIWMGNRWMTIESEPGPESALGILAEETMHRWGARVYYDGPAQNRLLDSLELHWSAFLGTGDSPLGSVVWRPVSGSFYEALPRGATAFSDLDLYLMGVLGAGDVAPMDLLVDVFTDTCFETEACAASWRDNPPEMVQAGVETVTIEQIVAVEGERTPAAGTAPSTFRQAWAYVVYDGEPPSRADLDTLESYRVRWEAMFGEATRELAAIDTGL